MTNVKDVGRMFDALLSLDHVRVPVKLDLKVPGYLTLVIALAVEIALSSSDPSNYLRKVITEEDQGRLMEVMAEMLQKAGLEGFYRKLKETNQV